MFVYIILKGKFHGFKVVLAGNTLVYFDDDINFVYTIDFKIIRNLSDSIVLMYMSDNPFILSVFFADIIALRL